MAAKLGDQPNMNSSPPVIDPSLYGFGGPKRTLDNGGKLLTTYTHWIYTGLLCIEQPVKPLSLTEVSEKKKPAELNLQTLDKYNHYLHCSRMICVDKLTWLQLTL